MEKFKILLLKLFYFFILSWQKLKLNCAFFVSVFFLEKIFQIYTNLIDIVTKKTKTKKKNEYPYKNQLFTY